MLGDVLLKNLHKLRYTSQKKTDQNAFWIVLRDIAVEEIISYNGLIDSDVIIPLYYRILLEHLEYIPEYFKQIVPSNHQERFRVLIRNLFSSNAFHPDGLANQSGITARREINDLKKGERIVYRKA